MFSRDNRGDDLFSNATFDTSNPDKIIIREKDEKKKKVRRRVKKGTKDAVMAKRQEVKKASKVKIVADKEKKSVYDTISFDVLDLDNEISTEKKTVKRDEKSFKLPRLSEIEKRKDDFDNNDLGSDFRKSSADWKDAALPDYSGLNDLSDSSFTDIFRNASWIQWVAFGLAVVLFVSSILTTNVYAKLQCADNREEAFSRLSQYEDTTFEQIAESVESVEAPISMEEAKPQLGKVLSLVLSSVEKDLKIKLIDEDDTLVKDIPWSVTIADNDGNSSEEADDDEDGIIHLTDVNAGDYSVTLNPNDSLADFELPTSAQMVSVKAKVEYKVIANIKDEIKSEKEINAAAEDAAGNQAADVETAPTKLADTVEFVESTKTVSGEEYVEAAVDLTKTAKLEKTGKLLAIAEKVKSIASSRIGNSTIGYPVLLTEGDNQNSACTSDNHDYNGGKCTICEAIDPNHAHNYSDWKCTICGAIDQTHTHNYVDGKCTICNEVHSHDFSGEKTSNDNGTHKIKCTSCDKVKEENCNFGSNGKCSVCGYQKPVTHTHKLDKYTSNNDGTHTIACTAEGCPGLSETEKKGQCDTSGANGVCSKCGYKAKDTASISLSGTATIKVNETTKITATITPSGKKITGVAFTDNSVASGTIDGNSITVKGLKAGTTKMSVTSDNGKSAEITIAVNAADQKYSDDAQLYDASKNALYVKEGESYRLAKYKDYKKDSSQKFYRKTETFIYTGWQTIDGQRCYYDKNHNKVTGKQVISGVEYDFGESGNMSAGTGTLGIDVSKYQPSINWNAVKASGVDYVIIRCGYRGSSTGVLVEDPYFKSHIKGAKAAGLKVGVYFFTTALTEAEAVEEASMCAYLCKGYGLDFPIFMDCESSPRAGYNGMSAGQRTAVIKAFCNTIRSAGYTAGVYANKTWLSSYMHAGELSGYKIWLAQYNAAGPTYSGKYDMWQYTSKGSVNGISGYVDMNKCYYR